MAFSNFRVLVYLFVISLVYFQTYITAHVTDTYHLGVDNAIHKSIEDFETDQKRKMTEGFTSSARRSYKKTKYSLAMEARNVIFQNALMSLQNMYPHVDVSVLVKDLHEKMPTHFDAFGAKRFGTNLDLKDRSIDKACHGFPLHLPSHVQPCRKDDQITCTERDQRIRRFNGECNNLEPGKKSWGAQVRPLERLLPRNNEKFQWLLHEVEQNTGSRVKRQAAGDEEMFWVADGCPSGGKEVEAGYKTKSFQAGVRCCSDDGLQCITRGKCPKNNMSKEEAELKCAEKGYRLCTKEELSSNVCCRSGGKCDSYQVWTSTPKSDLVCDAGNRGPGGTCDCSKAPGWKEGEWLPPWCYEGVCYTGQANDRCKGKPNGHPLGDGTWCWDERRDTKCATDSSVDELVCKAGDSGPGGPCDCTNAPEWTEEQWLPPLCYDGNCYAFQANDRCEGKPNGHSLGDGTWCWDQRRGTQCSTVPPDNELVCAAGDRGSGGRCDCTNAHGWKEGEWLSPWCYEGDCYTGQADDRCKGKPNGHPLGDGTWCWDERRDTKCATVCPSDCVSGSDVQCQDSTVSLPNARFSSSRLHTDADIPELKVTALLMQFAQFVDHDISLTPESSTTDCCKNPNREDCMPIMIPEEDAYFRQLHNQTCMQFTRSVPYCSESSNSCIEREGLNVITSLLDTSNIYGSDDQTANCLRSWQDGKLLTDENNLLPKPQPGGGGFGVQAGDARAPEMPALSSMHALWMREHNRICDMLKAKFPTVASDEFLYQNARRIVNAEFQNVVYSEQIPVVEGPSSIQKFNLHLTVDGSDYDPDVNPSVVAEFSGASYRYGHSLVQGLVNVHNTDGSFSHSYLLADNMFDPKEYNGNGFDKIIAGLTRQKSQKFDRLMSRELTERMFHGIVTPAGADYGLDLAALNIQRGRDLGLPSYYELYQIFGSRTDPHRDMSCWARRPETFTEENWNRLKVVYKHPRDIELFSGGLLEKRTEGDGILGLLFSTINSLQFSRLKDGDRFFFTHKNGASRFSPAAQQAIMNRKMSDIICDNTNVESVPTLAFLEVFEQNPLKICGQHTPLDLDNINIIDV